MLSPNRHNREEWKRENQRGEERERRGMERERAGRPVVAIKGPWRPPDDWRSGGEEELERGKEKGRERVWRPTMAARGPWRPTDG